MALTPGERLDRAIREWLSSQGRSVSIREVRRALSEGQILVNGRTTAPGARARGDEELEFGDFLPRDESRIESEPELPLTVLADWPDLVAVDKPSGMPCAPLRPRERGTLVGAVVARYPEIADAGPPLEGGLAHRLDNETSGIVLIAKTLEARRWLRRSFREHRVEKSYLARTSPRALPRELDLPIYSAGARVRCGPDGLEAYSAFDVEARRDDAQLVRVRTRFGRRHQVRVHLAEAGAPIDGDAVYGGSLAPRLMLHAATLRLPDDREVEAPLPEALW